MGDLHLLSIANKAFDEVGQSVRTVLINEITYLLTVLRRPLLSRANANGDTGQLVASSPERGENTRFCLDGQTLQSLLTDSPRASAWASSGMKSQPDACNEEFRSK